MARKGGVVMVVGVPPAAANVPLGIVQDHEVTLRGVLMYTSVDMRAAIGMLNAGTVPVDEIVSAVYPPEQVAEAFLAADDPETVKILVRYQEEAR